MNIKLLKAFFNNKNSLLLETGILLFIIFYQPLFTQKDYLIRGYFYIACLILIFPISRVIGLDKQKLGLTPKNFRVSLISLIIPVIISSLFLLLLSYYFPSLFSFSIRYPSKIQFFNKILFYVIISVPIQEIIFRGYFLNRLKIVSENKNFLTFSSAILFSLVHLPFGSILVTLGSFFLGIFLAVNFLRFRNIYSLMIAHGLIGILLIYLIN